jgi:predicted nucleic acid-binding protein
VAARDVRALLDTSVLASPDPVPSEAVSDGWAVSAVTAGELHAGVLMATEPAARAARLARLGAVLSAVPVLAVDEHVAGRYGELRAASGRRPANDLWIAATALAHGLRLVTRDEPQSRLPLVTARLLSG